MAANPRTRRADRPQVNLLGPVTITGASAIRPASVQTSTELIAFLALHPWATHELVDQAMWPQDRVTSAQRCSAMNRARNWLGTTEHNQPYVALVHDQEYQLHPDVEVDWNRFNNHLNGSASATTTTSLIQALRLVRGQPLTGVNPVRYTWADLDRQEMIAAVADTAAELAERSLKSRQTRVANWAAALAVTTEPSSEHLWRLRLRAAHLSANHHQIATLTAHARATLEPLGPLEPTTQRVLRQALNHTPLISPSRRERS